MTRASRNMVLATFFFSLMALEVKMLPGIPVYEIVFFRAAVTLVLCVLFLAGGKTDPFGHNRPVLFLRGLFGTVALMAFFTMLSGLPLATATTIQYLAPIFTALLSAVLLQEQVSWWQWFCYALAFAGVATVKGFDASVSWFYLIVGMIGSLGAACAYACIARLKTSEDPHVIMFYFPLVTLPVVAPYTLTHWVAPSSNEWLLLLGVGVTVQTAQYFMTRAYQEGKTSAVSIISYFGVVLALFYDTFLFQAPPPPEALVGIGLVVAGLILSSGVTRPRPSST